MDDVLERQADRLAQLVSAVFDELALWHFVLDAATPAGE